MFVSAGLIPALKLTAVYLFQQEVVPQHAWRLLSPHSSCSVTFFTLPHENPKRWYGSLCSKSNKKLPTAEGFLTLTVLKSACSGGHVLLRPRHTQKTTGMKRLTFTSIKWFPFVLINNSVNRMKGAVLRSALTIVFSSLGFLLNDQRSEFRKVISYLFHTEAT